MLEHRREMYSEVENKFLFDGNKYSVYVKGKQEIEILRDYLEYDYIKHQSAKMPFGDDYRIQDNEFVVSCFYKLSLVCEYPSDNMLGFSNSFFASKNESLPLFVFIDKNPLFNFPEYFI